MNIKVSYSVIEIRSIRGKIQFFRIIFLNKDISINILNNAMEFCMALLHIHSEGRVSQFFLFRP